MHSSCSHKLREGHMPISEIPIFSMLRTRMQWHQERQQVLSENIANADSTAQGPGGDPFRRKIATFTSQIDRSLDARTVALGPVRTDPSDFITKHEPGHPAADANGNVKRPNINPLIE